MNDWFFRTGSGIEGPFSAEQMQAMVRTGTIRPETEVRQADSAWDPAGNHSFLFPRPSPEPNAPDMRIAPAPTRSWPTPANTVHLERPPIPPPAPPALATERRSGRWTFFETAILVIAVALLVNGMLLLRSVGNIGAALEDQQRSPAQWEYLMSFSPDNAVRPDLAEFGDGGWEVISARRAKANERWGYEWIFKRRKTPKF